MTGYLYPHVSLAVTPFSLHFRWMSWASFCCKVGGF